MYRYLLAIFDHPTPRRIEFAGKNRYPAHPGDDEMTPPIFAAGLISHFDLESTVTILQQDFQGFWPGTRRSEALETRRAQGITDRRLPKSWANAGAFSLLTPKSKLAHY